jgi:hypothetical protein
VLDIVARAGRAVPIDEANIRRAAAAFGLAVGIGLSPGPVRAAEPSAAPPPTTVSTAASSSVAAAPTMAPGLAVLALAGAADAAWPLARSVYATPSLRPAGLDDASARVLCGEVPLPDAPAKLRDLAATVSAVSGDDAPSRAILSDIARRLGLGGLVVVRLDGGHPTARVFLADVGAFDSATYTPDEEAPAGTWTRTTQSLARSFGGAPAAAATPAPSPASTPAPSPPAPAPLSLSPVGATASSAPSLASHEVPKPEESHSRAFYESGWFWAALGAAAFAGGAVFLATRDSGPSTIHLQLEVSH